MRDQRAGQAAAHPGGNGGAQRAVALSARVSRPAASGAPSPAIIARAAVNCLAMPPLLLLFLLMPLSGPVRAETAPPEEDGKIYDTFTVYWENDTFAGTDRDYTNGLRLTWSTPYTLDMENPRLPEWSLPWLDLLPGDDAGAQRAVSLTFGHSIYTPANTNRAELDVNDRPYAGYSYLAATFHRRLDRVKTNWEFQFGVVGPLSLAEEFQNFTHDLLGNSRVQGWDRQLRNEPGLELNCERQWLLWHEAGDQGFNFDLIPHLGGRLGNINISVNLGGELRLGWNLPPTFGTCPIRGGCESHSAFNDHGTRPAATGFRGVHFFTGFDGRAVFHDIFLDGNTWADSHSVEREILVADLMAGISMRYGTVTTTYSYVYRTKQFKTQTDQQLFGAINVAWVY